MVTSAAVGSTYVAGAKIGDYTYEQDFPVLGRIVPVLGHIVNNAGSIAKPFEMTIRKMWKSFWGNAGSKGAKTLGRQRLAKLISRSVQPPFEFQCARWPAQITYLQKLDVLQRRMISIAFGLRRSPAENVEQYNRRCSRVAAPFIDCLWSHVWCKRMKTWSDHMARHTDLWPARVSSFQDSQWLQMRRRMFGSQSLFAGPTQTRSERRKVERRWHDGLQFAQEFLRFWE